MNAAQIPSIGRIVIYVREQGGILVERPAIIVHVCEAKASPASMVNLQVFNDSCCGNGGGDGLDNVTHVSFVRPSEVAEDGTYHFPTIAR